MKILSYKFFSLRRNKKTTPKLVSGFTLVELLVTISIFVVVTAVVLVNSNDFDNSVLLHNFSYDVALTIKEAQSYGVNVNENSAGVFNSSYGVYFNLNESSTNFILFNDLDNSSSTDSVTTCDITSECMQKYSMTRGTFIQSICAGNSESDCSFASKLSILFRRPNLGAVIYMDNDTINDKPYAKINLSATNGATSSVVVTSIGQIYVKK